MDPVLLAKLGRQVLTSLGTVLVTKGILDANQESSLETAALSIVGAAPVIYSVVMVIYRHFRPTPAIVAQVNAAAPT